MLLSGEAAHMSDTYSDRPGGTAAERRQRYLQLAAAESRGGQIGFFSQIARLELGVAIDEEPIREALTYIAARLDCSDFAIAGLLRLLYRHRDNRLLAPSLLREVEATILGFKFWWDEPGSDPMCYWTENHQIIFHSDELLAGQLFAQRTFGNTGTDGAARIAHALPRIRRWMDLRATFGFSEWLSNCYFDEDLIALVNLRDFAAPPDIRARAGELINLLLFEMALHSHRGVFGCSHGRTYAHMIKGARQEPTSSLSKLMFGMGLFNDPSCMSAIALASSEHRCPPIIEAVAAARPPRLSLRERHGIEVEDAPRYGLGFETHEDGTFFWGMESFVHPLLLNLSLRMVETYRIYEYPEVREAMAKYQEQLSAAGGIPAESSDPQALTEVNLHTYRTPHYLLSCAQDYRSGKAGYQQHIWQATLGVDAVVFTNQPGSRDEVSRPNYWAGNGRLPRAAQHENLLLCLHRVAEDAPLPFSHAYFPRAAFDEVVTRGHWTMARKGGGFIALYSQAVPRWCEDGSTEVVELRADAADNAWICELGDADRGFDFTTFVTSMAAAPVTCSQAGVRYRSPSQGEVSFGWDEPLRVAGARVALRDYRRFDNPYVRVDFAVPRFRIEHDGDSLDIDLGSALQAK